MALTILYHNTRNDKIYDISSLVTSLSISSKIEEQPTTVSIELINRDNLELPSGSVLSIKSGETPVFLGYQFKLTGDDGVKETLTFHDQLRYLQFNDTLALGDKTIGDLFAQICVYKNLRYKVVDNVPYILPPILYDNKTLYDILKTMLEDVFVKTGKKLVILDNFGTLELRDVEKMKTNLFFGDGSLLTGYSYDKSIDEETYNVVKLIREDSETKETEVVVEIDEESIKYWGQLQFHQKVNEGVPNLRAHALGLLEVYNREKKTLTLNTIGDIRVRAGVGIIAEIEGIKTTFGGARYYLVEECTHEISDTHHMTLKLKVI